MIFDLARWQAKTFECEEALTKAKQERDEAKTAILEAYRCLTLIGYAGKKTWAQKAIAATSVLSDALAKDRAL